MSCLPDTTHENECRTRRLTVAAALAVLLNCTHVWAQVPEYDRVDPATPAPSNRLMLDIESYVTAPLRWDGKDWAYFGGALAVVAASHHYDSDVRTHFNKGSSAPLGSTNSKDLQDALPAAAAFAGTWLYANLIDDSDGRREAWAMLEAAGLSSTTAFVLKFAAGRKRPDETTDPNRWGASGASFPSVHAAAAAAIGTVLAESGNDEYRWLRRVLGYGLASATGYERLKHNAHWLSDTVAGAALGAATAHFVMNRRYHTNADSALMLLPVEGGVMLSYSIPLR
ncbi:MAG: phosphatase PAP2 family protein [Gammaproteobacteria bacterium]|nr:MAG: phosphatase PAP2 family protein [Gammaproteobacteria bacterium]